MGRRGWERGRGRGKVRGWGWVLGKERGWLAGQ
jgi:hypothetical protein